MGKHITALELLTSCCNLVTEPGIMLTFKGSELSRPAGYPDGPLLRTGLAELPHPAPDRSVPPHIFSENGTLTEFSIAMGIPAF
ncbi:hypothetical protein BANRA_04656 [Escherichia coli]|nr:hypothetical protein FJMB80154_p10110 [Escherichia coli]BDV20285.1 hypothetical protein [Escherichia coli]VCX78123.1 hypothetical protein BANRA_04656 [Escherichia coli]